MADTLEHLRNFNYYPLDEKVNKATTIVEYIWIDGSGQKTRGKTRVYHTPIHSLQDLELWTYDGSSTDQASTENSEIYLKPVFMCNDPFRGRPHLLTLCETFKSDMKTPARYNFRWLATKIMDEAKGQQPWFGIEQEYFLFKRTGTTHQWPLGWPEGGFPYPQGRYYCSTGESNNFGRALAESHLRLCLNAGIKIAGVNSEVAPAQWEFQIGITEGIEIGDHLWIARYILARLGEEFGIDIVYDPKPIKGDWNGSGGHTNYSTNETRAEGGYELIKQKYIPLLEKTHSLVLQVYGSGNQERLTGKHETATYDKFSWGDGNRGGSIRVPVVTKNTGSGYLEDRRPAANLDPYLVSSIIVDVTLLNNKYSGEIVQILKDAEKNTGQAQH